MIPSSVDLELVSVAERPKLRDTIEGLAREFEPRFSLSVPLPCAFPREDEEWPDIYARWPHLQVALCDRHGTIIVACNALALPWDGPAERLPDDGWDWAVREGFAADRDRQTPNTLVPLAVFKNPRVQARGFRRFAVQLYLDAARRHGLARVAVPVRPMLKARYPIVSIDDYLAWRLADGRPFDPWVRAHTHAGGTLVRPCPRSMTYVARVRQWELWTGMRFPDSREYIVPAMLAPLTVDRESDRAVYVEPNIWFLHDLGAGLPGDPT